MKKAIYSVITGGYDEIIMIPDCEGWDQIMFTDMDVHTHPCWEIRNLPKVNDPLIQSRDIKIRSHIHLPEYDLVCYIDGNQKLLKAPPESPVWYTHTKRNNIFEEAQQIIRNGRFPASIVNKQIDYYISKGYNETGLYLNGFFVRNNKDEKINRLHDVWFIETCRFTPRDQLSLPFAMYLTGIEPENLTYPKEKEQYAIITKGHKQNYYL